MLDFSIRLFNTILEGERIPEERVSRCKTCMGTVRQWGDGEVCGMSGQLFPRWVGLHQGSVCLQC